MGYHDTLQACKNGHFITDHADTSPAFRSRFCPKCGEETITACESCNTRIPGYYHVEGFIDLTGRRAPVPAYCHHCGKPYPWTQRKIENFAQMVDELSELDEREREHLKKTLDDLIHETPTTEVASVRFKKIASKLGRDSYELVKKVATDLVSETVRKTLFGPSG